MFEKLPSVAANVMAPTAAEVDAAERRDSNLVKAGRRFRPELEEREDLVLAAGHTSFALLADQRR